MAHFVIGLIILSTILLQCLGGVYLSSLIDNKNSYNEKFHLLKLSHTAFGGISNLINKRFDLRFSKNKYCNRNLQL